MPLDYFFEYYETFIFLLKTDILHPILEKNMAELIKDGNTQAIEDGAAIQAVAEELGVDFGCQNGVCGACEIDVISGEDNLSKKTDAEEDYGCSGSSRLACQCKITAGSVEISQ